MAIVEYLQTVGGAPRKIALTNPASLEPLCEFECQSKKQVDAVVATARKAQKQWGATPLKERIQMMLKLRDLILEKQDEIVASIMRETGKPAQDALMMEVFSACSFISYWCKQAPKTLKDEKMRAPGIMGFEKKVHLIYKPLGVVAVIAPWNGPFLLVANPCVQAMLAGNAVVAKGSEVTPQSSKLFAALCLEVGIPEGVCNVVIGDGLTGSALTTADINKVSFTGSVATGKKVAAACAEKLIPCSLELGGKDAFIVCADADLDKAAHGAVWGGFVNTGHVCCAVERVYVEAPVYDAFVGKVTVLAKSIRQGQQHGINEDLGAVFWDRQLALMEKQVEDAKSRGAKALSGGERNTDLKGLYYPATIIVDVPEDADLMTKETFGPILPIIKVKDVEEAIAKANKSSYGLHGSVWTNDEAKGLEIAKRIETGCMAVNDIGIMYGVPNAPYGGIKESGVGSVNGRTALRDYSQAMPIVVGPYRGIEGGYPYSQEKYDQMKKLMNFLWKNPVGKFLFGP